MKRTLFNMWQFQQGLLALQLVFDIIIFVFFFFYLLIKNEILWEKGFAVNVKRLSEEIYY